MRPPLSVLAATLFTLLPTTASADNACSQSGGNWYCSSTSLITYSNFGQAGSFNAVKSMDSNSGTCTSSKQTFSGGLAPLDGEVSWHFRGPLRLRQFHFYGLDGVGKRGEETGNESGEESEGSEEGSGDETEEGDGEGETESQKQRRKREEWLREKLRRRHGHGRAHLRDVERHMHLHRDVEDLHDHENEHDSFLKGQDITPPPAEPETTPEEDAELNERGLNNWVTVTMNGRVVSWQNLYDGGAGSPATPAAAPMATPSRPPTGGGSGRKGNNGGALIGNNVNIPANVATKPSHAQTLAVNPAPPAAASSKPSSKSKAAAPFASSGPITSPPNTNTNSGSSSNGGGWTRLSTYNSASPSSSQNIAFLGHHGDPTCSGTFDYQFGLSLSYLTPNGQSCSRTPQPLSDILLPDNTEISVFSGSPCTSQTPCPYSRPGSVAHHGFGGASKLFLLEFEMPMSGKRGWNMDMPAAWILNAMVPRTLQYGKSECSCWKSGCGEFDVFEVLESGEGRMKSTWHGGGGTSYGDSNWFQRPAGGRQKAAVVMDGAEGRVSVVLLPASTDFASKVGRETVKGWLGGKGVQARLPTAVAS